ncbi:MAG: hypothetical protein ACYTFK_11525, partial [Planctomycetota bacterium]
MRTLSAIFSRPKIPLFLFIITVFLCATAESGAARRPRRRRSFGRAVKKLRFIDHIVTKKIDRRAVRKADRQREQRGGPYRFALARKVLITPWTDGTWEDIDDQTRLWRVHITAPDAMSVNLGFSRYYMPPGGEMFIYTAQEGYELGPFTEDDNKKHRRLWTPLIRSDDIVVEVTIPASELELLELELTSINHGYRNFGRDDKGNKSLGESGYCNVNTACSQGDDWRDQIRSVVAYSFWKPDGTYQCTGVLVNNTAADDRPYLLT